MTWRVEVGAKTSLLVEVIQAQQVWRRVEPAQRTALIDAYPDREIVADPRTLKALQRHGLADGTSLTEAGRIVAKWASR